MRRPEPDSGVRRGNMQATRGRRQVISPLRPLPTAFRSASLERMKRLVVCCDGTWNKPDSETITNVEKIARTVQTDPRATGGTYQLVYYIGGVGTAQLLRQTSS